MIASTLAKAVPSMSMARAVTLIDGLNTALWLAGCTTGDRSAMFIAEWSEESVEFTATREMGSDAYLKGQPYWPFIGATFGQLTWAYNYSGFGAWLHSEGELDDPDYFVKNPAALTDLKYAWDGPAWFWASHGLNAFADRGDIVGASYRINGGDHGLSTRIANWNHIRPLGDLLLPEEEMNEDQVRKIASQEAIKALQSFALGEPRVAPYTHHAHPYLFPISKNKGALDRIGDLEKEAK